MFIDARIPFEDSCLLTLLPFWFEAQNFQEHKAMIEQYLEDLISVPLLLCPSSGKGRAPESFRADFL
jgi:hypothetical protein